MLGARKENYIGVIIALIRELSQMVHGGNIDQCLYLKIISITLVYQSLKFMWYLSLI